MSIAKKGTLLIPTGPVKHLHIIMNNPVFSPEHGDERVLLVNISTVKPDQPYDTACILEAGCHPFIKQESYVYYKEAVLSSMLKMQDKLSLGEYSFHAPVDESLYEKVLAGFAASIHTKAKIERFLKRLS